MMVSIDLLKLIECQKGWHIFLRSLEAHEIHVSSRDVGKPCFGEIVAEFDALGQTRSSNRHRNLLSFRNQVLWSDHQITIY